MLLSFRCSNYRSIRDEQELSMIAGPTRNHEKHVYTIKDGHGAPVSVLKGALIYGGNGSGKSNLFKAIRFSTKLIIKDNPDFESSNYYMMDPHYAKKPSSFEYEFEINGHVYRYGFEIILSTKTVVSEYLNEIFVDGDDILIFARGEDNKCTLNGKVYQSDDENYFLFIHRGRDDEFKKTDRMHGIIGDVCHWFYFTMATLLPNSTLLYSYDLDDDNNVRKMGKLLSFFDTGITGMDWFKWKDGEENLEPIQTRRINPHSEVIRGKNVRYRRKGDYNDVYVLRCIHGDPGVPFRSDQESDGTRRLWDLSPVLLRDDIEFVYVIDEIDRYLHPLVVYAFIKSFMRKDFKQPKQIIAITHDTHLLDQDLLRRDEIWFIDKDARGASELYSLDDYNVRFDKKIEKAYLEGNFKGVPNIVLPEDLDDD